MIPLNKDEIQSSKFYFLSDKSNLTRIYPRVPKRRMRYEDSKTKRICCVKRIYSALKAIPIHNGMDLYIYEIQKTNRTKFAQPELTEVLDSRITHELQCLTRVNLKKVGKIKITSSELDWTKEKLPWEENKVLHFELNKNVTYHWVEKYKDGVQLK